MTRGLQFTVVAIAALALAGLGYWVVPGLMGQEDRGRAMIGGPFSLVDGDGRRFTHEDLTGRHHLIYFGYTFCTDVCPTTLLTATEAIDALEPAVAGRVRLVFVSVDPERDKPGAVKEYMTHFLPGSVGLTGSPAEVRTAAAAYRIYYRKHEPDADGDYLVDHSSVLYLMDPAGRYLTHFNHKSTPDEIASRLRRIL